MKTRLLNLWEMVRTSFWFIPGLMIFLAIGLSFVMIARASQESLPEKNDRDDVQHRYQALLDVLNEPALSNKTQTFLT